MPKQSSLNMGLDITPISQDPAILPDLYRLYNACNLLSSHIDDNTGAISADPATWSLIGATRIVTQNSTRLYIQCTEDLSPGNLVNIYDSSGAKCRKSGGGAWQGEARGFVLDTFLAGSIAEVFLFGVNNAITGMTPGVVYYASAGTAGLITAVPPASPHKQAIGFALDATHLWFDPDLVAV